MKTLHTIYTSFAKRVAIIFTLLISIGVTSVWGANVTFQRITSTSELTSGAKYLIVYESGKLIFNGSSVATGANGETTTVTISNNTITCDEAYAFTITSSSSSWKITGSNGKSIGHTGSSNSLTTGNYTNTITFSNNNVVIGCNSRTLRCNPNNGSPLFRYYTSGQQAIQLYKQTAPSTFTVTCQSNDANYGSVSPASVTNVANNTSISASGNKLTVGTTTVTATPKEQDANYTYAFSNWRGIPAGGKVTADVTVIANFTRTARDLTNYRTTCTTQTSVSTYTVKHCKEGLEAGTYPDDLIETETLEGTIGDQVIPERKNYTGFTAPSGQQVTIQKDGALVVTYQYTRKSYTLTWVLDGGKVVTAGTAAEVGATGTISQEVRYETPITAPIVQREGYRFNKWDSSVSNKMPASEKSFTATWVKTWDIIWKAQGNTIQTVTVDDGSYLTLPTEEITTCEGMTHIGWTATENYISDTDAPNDFFTYAIGTVTEAKTYYAIYAISCGYTKLDWGSEVPEGKYLISTGEKTIYGLNGNTTSYLGATTYTPTTDLKPEYEVYIRNVAGGAFAIQLPNTMWVGWKSSTDTKLISDSPENDASCIWKYTENGIQNQSAESRYLQINGAGLEGRVYTTTGSGSTWHPTYLYARNDGGYYTTCQTSVAIDYDLNGGTGNMSNTRVKSGSDYIIPTAVPTQVGKTFTHWLDGTNTYAAGATINNLTNDITLTAQWKVAQHTVTLNPNYPDGKTGTFKNNGGNTISGNLVLTYDYNTASMSLTDLYQSIELEGYQFNGWYSATSGGSKWTSTGIITKDVTVYAQWSKLHTVTFNTGTNNPTVDAMEGTSETGITLPAGPTPACSTDGWEFAGWWTEEVGATTTSPGELLTAGSNYKPTEDCTLYAVYSKDEIEEGGGTTPTEATLSFASTAQRTSFSTTQQVWEQNGIILTNNKSASTSPVADYSNPARFYASSEIIIEAPGNITQIVANCSKGASDLVASVGIDASSNNNVVTIIPAASSTTYTIAKLAAQVQMSSLTVTYLAESGPTTTTTYNSNPTCDICENILTINKGAETNGTFLLSQSDIETCDGVVEVVVTPTPAEHHSVASVTATTPTTGDAPTVTNNGNGTWTVTYAQDSKGKSTISVTFVEDAKASITLSELGVENTDNTTYYVGETYTLPSTSSQSCDGKQLVGWSTVEVAETDTKPTENYYELGAKVTLAAEQTFYAVYATLTAGGEGTVTKINADDDFYYGDKIIIIAENTNYGLYRSSSSNYVSYWTTSNNNGVPTSTEIEADAKRCIEISEGTTEETFKLGNATDGYLYNPSSTNLSISQENASDWELIAWTDNTFTFKAVQYLSCRTDITGTNANKWRGAGESCDCETNEQCSGTIYYNIYRYTSGTSYSAYTTSCIPTYSITYDFASGIGSHCSNTSVPQGEEYTICEEEPIKEGHTFQGWSDGTSTYAAGTTITPTKNTTLTAQWQINTYTVIWSNNGATTPVDYNHGDALEVPAAPASCDGVKEFVGWTEDNTFTYHATTPPSDIFTEKTATVTADATYYAVFATPPGTGGGGGGSETTTTLDFTAQGYANETAISNLTVDGVTATFAKGSNSNAPKYYTNGTAIRAYGGNTITLSANQITAATFTFGGSDGSNEITADCGSWDSPTWTGDATDEVVFTISGSSGNRRIQSIAVTYTSGGGSGSYSDYTTICQQIESIEVQNPQTEFYLTDAFTIGEGKVMATLSDGITKVDVTSLATFSGYNMEVVGTYTVTVTYMGATATYNINVKPLDNAWVLTWNVSGKTNTGLGPRYVTKGTAIGTLPTPVVPDACEGKTFMGWTESNIVPSDGVGIEYIEPTTVPTDNTTYYAVFATVNNFCTQKPIDQITSGSKVVIVAVASLTADGGSGKAISSRATDDTHNLQGDDVAIYDQTINTPHSTCIWTIAKEDGKCVFTQDGKYLNGVLDGKYSNLKYLETKDSWTLTPAASGMTMTYNMESTNASGEYIEWYNGKFAIHNEVNENGDFDMQFYVTANADGNADITDYTTGCEEYTITYYGFRGGYSTSTSSDGIIVLPVNSMHTVPNCGDVVTDHTNLGREFLNVWMTQPHGGHTFEPGDTFILTQDTTLYAQWKMETTSDVTTLPTDIEDLAGTDVYVYGGKTLNIQPGTTTINSLTLKGGLQSDGSYKMPIVWVPEGATLVRNSNKIYLDLVVNAKNYYPFAVPFATKNDQYLDYLDPVLNAASRYDTHFVIKTYDGALRAKNGEDRANNWVKVLRHQSAEEPSYLQPGVGYIIQALTYPDKDTATIRIPMTVPNTWFENGEQAVVGTTVRNSIAVTAHAGAAATEHQRHAGWNFVASPYLTNFAGSNVVNGGDLAYIKGELTVNGGWQYGGDNVPYVTIPAYDFSYYTQHKLSDVKLSPEWSFFVQIGTGGTMDFSTAGRQETPASIAARHDAAQSFKMDVDITLSDKNHSDQMGLIICDRFTSAYEVGYDLEKMFGSAYNLTVYTLMEDNTPLAYHALAIHSNMQVIPVGYRVPEQGDYTFALNQSTSSIDLLNEQYEQLILVDYETGALTNLLNSTYTFTSPRTQSDSRFAIYAVIRQKTPTDLPNIDDGDTSTRKILHNGHLYILRDGKVYNGNGQIVK